MRARTHGGRRLLQREWRVPPWCQALACDTPPGQLHESRGSVTECSRARDSVQFVGCPEVCRASTDPAATEWQWATTSPSFCREPRWPSRLGGRPPRLGRSALGRRVPGRHPPGLPAGPGGRVVASLLVQLLLQPLLLLLQVSGHIVKGGLVETAEAVTVRSGACAGGARADTTWDSDSGRCCLQQQDLLSPPGPPTTGN